MVIQIEWFLLDNALMNLLMIRLAAALIGKRLRWYAAGLFSLCGAAYALLSVTAAPFLSGALPKISFGALAALLLRNSRRGYWKGLLALFLSAFFMGGLVLGITLLFGGGVSGGALIGTVPVRIMLLSGVACTALPRIARSLVTAYRHRARYTRIRLVFCDRVMELRTLIDSGNLLTEPLSGLPVVIVRPGLLPKLAGRPVPCAGISGTGMLSAIRPDQLLVFADGWMEVDAFVAAAEHEITAAEAVMSAELYFTERKYLRDTETDGEAATMVQDAAQAEETGDLVRPLGGNAADAVRTGGGGNVDSAPVAGRPGGCGRADRA